MFKGFSVKITNSGKLEGSTSRDILPGVEEEKGFSRANLSATSRVGCVVVRVVESRHPISAHALRLDDAKPGCRRCSRIERANSDDDASGRGVSADT